MEYEQDINALVAQAEKELKTDATDAAAAQATEVNDEIWEPIPDDDDPTLTKIMDVPMEDVYNGPRLKTGIKQIDSCLYGGIKPGGVAIIAGHEGGGKTSWALQIIARAMIDDERKRQAKNPEDPPYSRGCAIFSSEMPAKKLHRILAHQLAKPGEIKPTGPKDYPKYIVSEEVDKAVKKTYGPWIRGLEPEISSRGWKKLTGTCERQAKQGRRYFVLDNMMTLANLIGMDPDHRGQGENSLQLAVAAWAAEFAAKYDVWVILIAHTRKEGQQDAYLVNTNDTISGSKTISNIATAVMFFTMLPIEDRRDNPDTPDRLARLTKNRDHDRKLLLGVRTEFDPASWTVYEKGTKDETETALPE